MMNCNWMNERVCWRMIMKWQLDSFCFSFLQCLIIVINLFLFFLDWDLRKRNVDQIGRNDRSFVCIYKVCFEYNSLLICFFFLIWGLLKMINVKTGLKNSYLQQLVKLGKESRMWFFTFVEQDEIPSRLDWLSGLDWLQSIKQSNSKDPTKQYKDFKAFFNPIWKTTVSMKLVC